MARDLGNRAVAPLAGSRLATLDVEWAYRPGQKPVADEELVNAINLMVHDLRTLSGAAYSGHHTDLAPDGSAVQHDDYQVVGMTLAVTRNTPEGSRLHIAFTTADAEGLCRQFSAELQRRAQINASLSFETAADQLAQAQGELKELSDKKRQIIRLGETRKEALKGIAAEHLKSLELERRRLQMDVAAKDARGRAIQKQMSAASETATMRKAADPVVDELRKAVASYSSAYEFSKKQFQAGLQSEGELRKAEQSLIQGKTRVAEREQQLAQSSATDLVARLAEDLATLTIDQAELRSRLDMVERRLPPEDFNQLNETQLKDLNALYDLGNAESSEDPPLLNSLIQRQAELVKNAFFLQVASVKILSEFEDRDPDRRIQPFDLLRIDLSGLPLGSKSSESLPRTVGVRQEETITLPYINPVSTSGLTEKMLEQRIIHAYHELKGETGKQLVHVEARVRIVNAATSQPAGIVTTTRAAMAPNGNRRISKNDVLSVEISDLNAVGVNTVKTSRVSESGNISLPFINQVNVDGMTEAEAEQKIADTYAEKQIVQKAQISVTLVDPPATQPSK